jgi:hypothetical protein
MKFELTRHLDKARDTVTEVERIVSLHGYPTDKRTVLTRGLLSTIIEHHRGMLILIKSGTIGSAYALARDIVKGMRYGLWINSCATEEQIHRTEVGDEFPLSIPEMTAEIESVYKTDRFFESLKNRWATQLYKYSLSSVMQLGHWEIDASSGLHYDDEKIGDVATIGTICILLLAAMFLATQKCVADCEKVETLAGDFASS